MSARDEDHRWMERALALAPHGGRRVQPNPRVGAVIVKEGRLIGEGWHREAGAPHAEREALAAAGAQAAGATLYVTLEPCHLTGRTPPCSEAILEAGLARVVYALEDPNPAESGRSTKLLREAGLQVDAGLMADSAAAQNPGYITAMEKGRPFVTLKSGATLNGMLARADGSSQWITGEEARRRGHLLRAEAGGVVIGAETARLDRPSLDLRLIDDADTPPRPVVIDSEALRCPPDLGWKGRQPLLVLPDSVAEERLEPFHAQGWEILPVPGGEGGRVDLGSTLVALLKTGLNSLLVEGGGRLTAAFIEAGLFDRWELFTAPRLFPAGGRPFWPLETEPGLRLAGVREAGSDIQISLLPEE